MTEGDGNLAALAKYEKEQDNNERAYESFHKTVEDEMLMELEDLKGSFDAIAERYGFEEEKFYEWVKNNI